MKTILFLSFALFVLIDAQSQTPTISPQQWSQITNLSDEFNSFNSAMWKNEGRHINNARNDIYLNPKSYGTGTNNIGFNVPTGSITGSAIFLKFKKENPPITESTIFPINYTGVQLRSVAKLQFGYYEIRAKLPQTTSNVGATFWLYSQKCPGDYSPGNRSLEIDIYEMCTKDPSVYPINLHTMKCNSCSKYNLVPPPPPSDIFKQYVTLSGKNFTTDYHIMALDWQPDYIDWYVDNEVIYHIDNNLLANHLTSHPDCSSAIDPLPSSITDMSIPLCVFFEAAISDSYAHTNSDLPSTAGEQYEIDYFRYYKKMPQLGVSTANLSSNTATLNASAISGDVISWTIGGTTYYSGTHNFSLTANTNYNLGQMVKASQTIVQSGQSYVAPIVIHSEVDAFLSYGGLNVSLNTVTSSEGTLIYISDAINSNLNYGTSKNVIMRSKGDIYFTDGFGIELGSMLSAEVDITQ